MGEINYTLLISYAWGDTFGNFCGIGGFAFFSGDTFTFQKIYS